MTTDDPQKIKARLTEVAADVRDVYQDAVCCINELQAELDDYKQAPGVRAEHYKQKAVKAEAERDHWQKKFKALRDGPAIELGEERKRLATRTPRVITAEELRQGQLICIHRGHGWGLRAIGTFQGLFDNKVTLRLGSGEPFTESIKFHTIVLLTDAPDEQQEPEAEKPGYQKFYDRIGATDLLLRDPYKRNAGVATSIKLGEGSYRIVLPKSDQQEPERMTVKWSGERRGEPISPEDILDGDVVDKWRDGVRVAQDVTFESLKLNGVFIYSNDDDEFRLVHRPTPAPVTAETIRASEPGSTFVERNGKHFWEWDGFALRHHSETGGLGNPCDATAALGTIGPLTRSTAAPRGDYGKKGLPTEPGELIAVTEFDGLYDAVNPILAYLHQGDWYRLDGEPWPDPGNEGSYREARADQITGWKPAKIVTDA